MTAASLDGQQTGIEPDEGPQLPVCVSDDPSVRAAAVALLEQRAEVERWEERRAAAEAELAELDARTGEEVLADPDADQEVGARMLVLHNTIRSTEKALAVLRDREAAAERAYVAAEAEVLAPAVASAQQALEAHRAKVQRLLGQLEKLEGPHISTYEHQRQSQMAASDAVWWEGRPQALQLPRSKVLERELLTAHRRLEVMRELARGGDPQPLLRQWNLSEADAYPLCVTSPEALVRAPHLIERIRVAREELAELEALPAELERQIEAWEAHGRQHPGAEERQAAASAVARRQQRLEELPAEIEAARERLAALVGKDESTDTLTQPRRRLWGRRSES